MGGLFVWKAKIPTPKCYPDRGARLHQVSKALARFGAFAPNRLLFHGHTALEASPRDVAQDQLQSAMNRAGL